MKRAPDLEPNKSLGEFFHQESLQNLLAIVKKFCEKAVPERLAHVVSVLGSIRPGSQGKNVVLKVKGSQLFLEESPKMGAVCPK